MTQKLIIALDYDKQADALSLIDQLDPESCSVKIGSEMFTLFGADFVRKVMNKKFKVFLDLKFHDIPNTVENACKAAADLGVWMLTVHASGGNRMMQAASQALVSYGPDRPKLVAVTLLTSLNEQDIAILSGNQPIARVICRLAESAKVSGLDGVVCSAHEVPMVKEVCGKNFIAVTPGIRLAEDLTNDQLRVATPLEALQAGSDYLVIGRTVTHAANPAQVVYDLMTTINAFE